MALYTPEGKVIPNTGQYDSWSGRGEPVVIPRDPTPWETGQSDVLSGGAEPLGGVAMHAGYENGIGTNFSVSDTQVAASALVHIHTRQY